MRSFIGIIWFLWYEQFDIKYYSNTTLNGVKFKVVFFSMIYGVAEKYVI